MILVTILSKKKKTKASDSFMQVGYTSGPKIFSLFFKLLPVKMTLIAIKTSVKNEKSKAVFMGAKFHKNGFLCFLVRN